MKVLGRRALGAVVASVAMSCAGAIPSALPRLALPAAAPPHSSYAQAIREAAHDGLRVWLEADLVRRWLEGSRAFDQGLVALGRLAALPGVVGIKYADELAYGDGLGPDPAEVGAFLAAAGLGLHRAAPGKALLVDMIVPELGCAPGLVGAVTDTAACRAEAVIDHPALTLSDVDGYVRSGGFDVLDLSTGLLDADTYASWGIDRPTAQRLAWTEVRRRGWGGEVRLQARKALAHAGDYAGAPAAAEATLQLYVDIPLSESAAAVDLWTWRQPYQGAVVRLMNPGLRSNPLWTAIVRRHRCGAELFTHFTPSSVERTAPADLAVLSRGFGSVFMAAGIG